MRTLSASRKKDIIKFFDAGERGVRKTAEAFNLTTQAVYAWPAKVHKHIALEAQEISGGVLKYDQRDYP